MTQELAIKGTQSIALTPSEVVSNASIQAKLLMDIVEQTKCFQVISGKKYLQVEAWETIGAFNRVHAVTESITPIMDDGVKVGYDAKVTLVNQDGMLVGAAIMPCYFTENACKGKEGDAKDKACKSAAQTFATSKAYRMNYSYIAILAGYQPTPAEEITGDAVDDRPANLEHWCEEHQTKFFKRGKMPAYAHPVKGTDPLEWCQEGKPIHSVEQVAREMAKGDELAEAYREYTAKSNTVTQADAPLEKVTGIDLEWVRENIGLFGKQNNSLVSWLKSKANFSGLDFTGSLSEIIARFTREQAKFLNDEIESRREMR